MQWLLLRKWWGGPLIVTVLTPVILFVVQAPKNAIWFGITILAIYWIIAGITRI